MGYRADSAKDCQVIEVNNSNSAINSDSSEVRIRSMSNQDITSYCILFQSVFAGEPWNEKWTISKIEIQISRQIGKKTFNGMVATTSYGDIGYLTGFRLFMLPSIFYLDQLFVRNDYQRKQIGQRLLTESELSLKSQGVTRIFLLTKPRSYAEKFYLKNAFKPCFRGIHINAKCIYGKHL